VSRPTTANRAGSPQIVPSLLLLVAIGFVLRCGWPGRHEAAAPPVRGPVDRSPVDLLLTPDEKYLITVNLTSDTVSLVDLAGAGVCSEVAVGHRPSALAMTRDGRTVLVTGTYSGDLTLLSRIDNRLQRLTNLYLGDEPRGLAVSSDDKTAYVALTTDHSVAVIDIPGRKEVTRIHVGRWPRYLALSSDDRRLAVGVNGDGGVAVVDTVARKCLYMERFTGINLGQMQVDRGGKHVYFPWMVYRNNPITTNNVRQGWVLASRIARVRLDGKYRRDALALDPAGQAVADPHGLALSPDERWMVCAASGTQELLVYQTRRPYRRRPAQVARTLRQDPAGRPAHGGSLLARR
jgi:YVTN family beta-propeller protein